MQKQEIINIAAPAHSPWRRYLAWLVDYALCMSPVYALLYGLLRISPVAQGKWLSMVIGYAAAGVQMLIEPVLLHAFGPTPGKALMGLRVLGEDGQRPSLKQARARTMQRFVRGLGCMVPVLQWVCAWKNGYKPCREQEMCSWDGENALVCQLRDHRRWRAWACAAAIAMALALNAVFVTSTAQPPCHGSLTVAQFAQNYNYLTRYYYGSDAHWLLDAQGAWVEDSPANAVVIYVGEEQAVTQPVWQFTLDAQGCIVTAQLDWCVQGSQKSVYTEGIRQRAMLGAMALTGAQSRDCGWTVLRVARAFEKQGDEIIIQLGTVRMAYRLQMQGMAPLGSGLLIPTQEDNSVRLTLQMEIGAEAF